MGAVPVFVKVAALTGIAFAAPVYTETALAELQLLDLRGLLIQPAFAQTEVSPQIQAPMVAVNESNAQMFAARGVSTVPAGDTTMPSAMAFTAVPEGAPPAGLHTHGSGTKESSAQEGLFTSHLREAWQKMAFIAGLAVLAGTLFWRLGLRGRQQVEYGYDSWSEREQGRAINASPVRAHYNSLYEAIEAMKAQAGSR